MKILLLGEYSNLHNSLKTGLVKLGHDVTLISSGDGFKGFNSDILLKQSNFSSAPNLLKRTFEVIFKYPFHFYRQSILFQNILPKIKGYDYIQLINEHAIGGVPWIEKSQLKKLSKQNKNIVLLCCGDDYNSVNFYLSSKELRYSVLTPLLENSLLKKEFKYSLKYVTNPFRKLGEQIHKTALGCIASDIDYHIPLRKNQNYLGMIPNPVVLNKVKASKQKNKYPKILLGVNTNSQLRKGTTYFERALKIIKKKHPNISIKQTKNLPFDKYIQELNNTDILLDQVYGYDQGYNALEAMALGKVVFTGAEKEFLDYYNIKEDEVAINALPDVNYLVEKLTHLIQHPELIKKIGANAKEFVKKHHEATMIAQKYVETWTSARRLSE